MDNKELNVLQASFLVVIVTITHLILNLPNALILSTGSSAIINVIYISILAFIMFLVVKKFLNVFDGNNIIYVAEYVGGKSLKKVLSILYIIHFIFITGILLRSFSETLLFIYFPHASTWSVLLAFLLVAVIAYKYGGINIIKANAILMVPILGAIVVTALSLIGKFEVNRLFPIVGYGFKNTFVYGASNIYAFSGVIYIPLIQNKLKNIKYFSRVGFISIGISACYLLISVSALLMLFPFLTCGNQAMTVYLSTRIIDYGKFMQRTDAIYMFVWIFIFFSYLSVILIYINHISIDGLSIQNESIVTYVVAFLIYVVAILPDNLTQIRFLETVIYKQTSLVIVFLLSTLILFLGFLKRKKELRRKEHILV